MVRPNRKSHLPDGWTTTFIDRADLDHAFEQLGGRRYFYIETLRGRIRSLQLRWEEADAHFDEACALFESTPKDTGDLIRRFLTDVYRVENLLLTGPLEKGFELPMPWVPELPDSVLEEYPEIRMVLRTRRIVEGAIRLHVGDLSTCREIFESLLADDSDASATSRAVYGMYLGAATYNAGLHDECLRRLEEVELHLQSGGRTLNRAKAVGMLYGFFKFLGEDSRSDDWKHFLLRMDCPRATKNVFLRRGDILVERSVAQKSLLPI